MKYLDHSFNYWDTPNDTHLNTENTTHIENADTIISETNERFSTRLDIDIDALNISFNSNDSLEIIGLSDSHGDKETMACGMN